MADPTCATPFVLPRLPFDQARGKCFALGPSALNLFFSYDQQEIFEAKRICSGCPVRAECLAYALPDYRIQGVWGGTSTWQREQMRKGLSAEKEVKPRRRRVASMDGRPAALNTGTKRCSACREDKPKTEFSMKSGAADGLDFYCRDCLAEKNRKYREKRLARERQEVAA